MNITNSWCVVLQCFKTHALIMFTIFELNNWAEKKDLHGLMHFSDLQSIKHFLIDSSTQFKQTPEPCVYFIWLIICPSGPLQTVQIRKTSHGQVKTLPPTSGNGLQCTAEWFECSMFFITALWVSLLIHPSYASFFLNWLDITINSKLLFMIIHGFGKFSVLIWL